MTPSPESEPTNAALEFHDSEVSSIKAVAGGVHVCFAAACVHYSNGTPGVDAGKGFARAVKLHLHEVAAWSGNLNECVGNLSDGKLKVDDRWVNLVPLPFEEAGMVTLYLQFSSGTVFSAKGTSVNVSPTGPSRFVENFAC
jgi:hypothetical protein